MPDADTARLQPDHAPDPAGDWMRIAEQGWQLSMDMALVMTLRGFRMMGGGALAKREGRRMVSEKVAAGATLWPAIWGDGMDWTPAGAATRALKHYRAPVSANRRRLSRG